jgi:hypothetical protein
MRTCFALACLLFAVGSGRTLGTTGSGTLNLVTGQTGINRLTITVGATAGGFTASDTETTTVTGSINATFNANPASGATTAMTITGGSIAMTDMRFQLKALFIITVADISTAGMRGTAYTPPPVPATVTATATGGTFDAALHRVLINQGTITGSITATNPPTPVNSNFATSPVEGAGVGTGTVTMVPGAFSANHRTMQVTIEMPVDFTDTQDLSGTPVSVRVQGTIRATGPVNLPLDPLAAPVFNLASGSYPSGQNITITGESGSTVFYRLNGGPEQSAASPVTTLTVPAAPATLTITAFARKTGFADSPINSATYTGSAYKTWTHTFFPGVTDPSIVGHEADPDRDGQPNFLEFTLGGQPNHAGANAIVHPRIADSDDVDLVDELLLTIAVRTGTPAFSGSPAPSATLDGMTCRVEGSGNLVDFSHKVVAVAPVATGLPAPPPGYEYRTFSLDQSGSPAATRGFLRVRVNAAP